MQGQGKRALTDRERDQVTTWRKLTATLPGVLIVWEPGEVDIIKELLASHPSYTGTIVEGESSGE